MKVKEIITALMILALTFGLLPEAAKVSESKAAEEYGTGKEEDVFIVHEGKDGAITWSIDSNGCLLLRGNGDWEGLGDTFEITGSGNVKYPKWLDYSDDILSAKVDVTGLTNCQFMFAFCTDMESLDLSGLDTSQVTNMEGMFNWCSELGEVDLRTFDTSRVKNMSDMFRHCESLTGLDLKNFNTSNVTHMSSMFSYCTKLTDLNLSSFDTRNLKYMGDMFSGCENMRTLDLSSFQLSNLEGDLSGFRWLSLAEIKTPVGLKYMSDTDYADYSLPYGGEEAAPWKDSEGNVYKEFPSNRKESVTLTREMEEKPAITSGECCGLNWKVDAQGTLVITGSFKKDEDYDEDPLWSWEKRGWHEAGVDIKSCIVDADTTGLTNCENMFSDLPYLESIEFIRFNTSDVTTMYSMFSNDSSLKEIDVSGFDTSKTENMYGMFYGCKSLEELDVTQFRTEKVRDFIFMFGFCRQLKKLDLRNMTVENAEILEMFNGCNNLRQLQVGRFSPTYSLQNVFADCHRLDSIDISDWNLENLDADGYSESCLRGCVSLLEIRTPLHLTIDIPLPDGKWTDEKENLYTSLPLNQNSGLLLTKQTMAAQMATPVPTSKPITSPLPVLAPKSTVSPDKGTVTAPGRIQRPSVKRSGKKAVKLSWKKVKGANGYQIQYALNKKFTKKKKSKLIKINKNGITIKKLKKKTYYFRIRAYKLDGKKRLYGKWSKVKRVKVKS